MPLQSPVKSRILSRYKLLLFSIIFSAGVFLRLHNLLETTSWYGDPGRDLLVARHLVYYRDAFLIASPADSRVYILNHSAIYYWIVAIFYFFSQTENGVILLFAYVGIATVLIAYFVSKELYTDAKTLILPLVISISPTLIVTSRSVWQPHLLPFFELVSLLFLFRGIKSSTLYFYLSVQFAFLAFHLHYQYLFILVITILYVTRIFLIKKNYIEFLKFIIFVVINTGIWLYLTRALFNLQEQTTSLSSIFIQGNLTHSYLSHLVSSMAVLGEGFFGTNYSSFIYFLLPLVFFSLIKIYSNSSYLYKETSKLLLIMLLTFFFFGTFYRDISLHHSISYHLLILVSIAFIFGSFWKFRFVALTLFIMFTIGLIMGDINLFQSMGKNELSISKRVALAIVNHSKNSNIRIWVCLYQWEHCQNKDWYTAFIYYFLENYYNMKLGQVTNRGNNFEPRVHLDSNAKTYIICFYLKQKCVEDLDLKVNQIEILYEYENTSAAYIK